MGVTGTSLALLLTGNSGNPKRHRSLQKRSGLLITDAEQINKSLIMAILTILRQEILDLTRNRCAAELLEFFKNQRCGWFKITLQEIREKFRGLYGKDAIATATGLLDDLGLVQRRKHPYNRQDKTWQYRFDKEQLDKQQTWMSQGWCPLPGEKYKATPEVEQPTETVSDPPLEVENQTFSIYIDPDVLDPINFDPPTIQVVREKDYWSEEIQIAIADAPFMQGEKLPEPATRTNSSDETKFSAGLARNFLQRLRDLNVPLTEDVRLFVRKTPVSQLERNICALEEEAQSKGLRSPIAACKHFIKNNCQPRDEPKSWFTAAEKALGKERRDRLIQAVSEYAGVVWVFFKNGRQIALAEVQDMTWEAIAGLGDGS